VTAEWGYDTLLGTTPRRLMQGKVCTLGPFPANLQPLGHQRSGNWPDATTIQWFTARQLIDFLLLNQVLYDVLAVPERGWSDGTERIAGRHLDEFWYPIGSYRGIVSSLSTPCAEVWWTYRRRCFPNVCLSTSHRVGQPSGISR